MRARVANDGAADAILDSCCGSNVRLVVMATHCRQGLGRVVFGSVAMAVLHHARLPILLVHPTKHAPAPGHAEDERELENVPG